MAFSAAGQTNADPDLLLQPSGAYNLSPLAKFLPKIFWAFGATLLVIAAALGIFRYRLKTNLYKAASDAHWQDDAQEEAAVLVDAEEVAEACADFGKAGAGDKDDKTPSPKPAETQHVRLYTPASGPAWNEPMLEAFLFSCLKASCLGRAWHEEGAPTRPGLQGSRRPPDPREAEFIRKLKARWHEFHVDPDHGIFLDHAVNGSDSSRVCVIGVDREKHTVTRAALNAGIVIESVGRYLKSTDLAYPAGPGYYHAPGKHELAELSAEQKKALLRLKNIPNPWQIMLAGPAPGRGHTHPLAEPL